MVTLYFAYDPDGDVLVSRCVPKWDPIYEGFVPDNKGGMKTACLCPIGFEDGTGISLKEGQLATAILNIIEVKDFTKEKKDGSPISSQTDEDTGVATRTAEGQAGPSSAVGD